MKLIVAASLLIGVVAAIVAPFIADLHLYRVTSGYSGQDFWLSYSREPSEEQLLDSIIYRERLIESPYSTVREWRKAQAEGNRLFIKKDAAVSILVMPYDESHDPDPLFPVSDTKGPGLFDDLVPKAKAGVRGVWLTEPSTRTKYWPPLIGAAYSAGSFVVFGVGTLAALALIRWVWYFLLRRVAEFSSAVRGNDH
jgi:hypothetical protein